MGCVLCDIIAGTVTERMPELARTDAYVICHALKRDAPLHLLGVPATHVATIDVAEPGRPEELIRALISCYKRLQRDGFTADGLHYPGNILNGYRIVINQGFDGGQSVIDHYHPHLVAGLPMEGMKSDGRAIGDHMRHGMYPPHTILAEAGEGLEYRQLTTGMWVFVRTEDEIHEFRYFGGRMFYWRQENVHVEFDGLAVGRVLNIHILWPQLLKGSEQSPIRHRNIVQSILIP